MKISKVLFHLGEPRLIYCSNNKKPSKKSCKNSNKIFVKNENPNQNFNANTDINSTPIIQTHIMESENPRQCSCIECKASKVKILKVELS